MRRTISYFILFVLLKSFSRCSNNERIGKWEPDWNIPDNSKTKSDIWPHKPHNNIINYVHKVNSYNFYEKDRTETHNTRSETNDELVANKTYFGPENIEETEDVLLANKTATEKSYKNKTEELDHNDECRHFKCGASKCKFNLNKMAGVWQTAYYQLPEEVHCFKIQIKKVTPKEQIYYKTKYGDHSNKIKWFKCSLEIIPKTWLNRTHLLQGDSYGNGVFNNIIIDRVEDNNPEKSGSYNLLVESADQWLVLNNLLLMRDCDTGGVVVFSKLPYKPVMDDIKGALKDFGEDNVNNGKIPCEDEESNNKAFVDDPEEEVISVDT